MVLFDSLYLLSSIDFVLYFNRPTIANTLTIISARNEKSQKSIVKRGNPVHDSIECPGPLPEWIPPDFPTFPSLLQMCSSREGHIQNLECVCVSDELVCGATHRRIVQIMIDHCFAGCECASETIVIKDRFTTDLKANPNFIQTPDERSLESLMSRVGPPIPYADPLRSYTHWNPSGNGNHHATTHTCKNTCTRVSRGCAWADTGDCKCYALPIGLFFWHSSNYGSAHDPTDLKRRGFARQRRSYHLNATAIRFPQQHRPSSKSLLAELRYASLPVQRQLHQFRLPQFF